MSEDDGPSVKDVEDVDDTHSMSDGQLVFPSFLLLRLAIEATTSSALSVAKFHVSDLYTTCSLGL